MSIALLEEYVHELILEYLPNRLIESAFDPFFIDEVTTQIIFETLKLDFDRKMEQKATSLRQLRGADYDEDKIKQSDHRMIQYVQHYRTMQAERIKQERGHVPKELEEKKFDSIQDKLTGHRVTPMQYDEMKNMKDVKIFKKLIGKQLCSSKKVSNSEFVKLYNDYDATINYMSRAMKDDESTINNTLSFFTIEWLFVLEWAYKVADTIDRGTFPEDKIVFAKSLCLPISGKEHIFGKVSGENRLFMARDRYLELYSNLNLSEEEIRLIKQQYYYTFAAAAYIIEHYKEILMNKMVQISDREKVEFLKKKYWLWDKLEHKEWNRNKIATARRFFDITRLDVPSPKID